MDNRVLFLRTENTFYLNSGCRAPQVRKGPEKTKVIR